MASLLGFTNAVSSVGGGSTTLTVVNNSSVDRQQNEKVWIRQIVGGWEIIDWALADVNSLTAKCDSAIVVGGTGTVSLADDGQVIQHLVRNFSLGSGVQESEIDDANQLFTYDAYEADPSSPSYSNKYLVSGQLNLPSSQLDDLMLKITFKFSPVDPNAGLTVDDIKGKLMQTTHIDSTTYPTGSPDIHLPHILAVGNGTNKLVGEFYNGVGLQIELGYGYIVNFDKWITATLRFNNNISQAKARFDIWDYIRSSDYGVQYNVPSRPGGIKRVFIGCNDKLAYQMYTTIDLAKTGLYTADGNTTLWEPYIQA